MDVLKEELEKEKEKFLFADLHIHSKYSRACSKDLDFSNLSKWAKIKGLNLLGTGDFTHPIWFSEIEKLREEDGIFYHDDFPFILTSEISLIYSVNEKGRRVHLVIFAPDLDAVRKIHAYLDGIGRRDYDGRPIFGISCRDFAAKMEEIDQLIELIPAHIWTPWFGLYGSKGGFDSIKDAFLDKTSFIHAIETGISSDPDMNWKIKDLDNRAIVSFSDAHSFWPYRLGREATIFKKPESGKLSYKEIIRQIREKDFYGTIETDPAYGKYHFDGHRNCEIVMEASETRKINGICPVCKKPLTIGVEYRVNDMEKMGISNHNKKKFYYRVLPLHEIISLATGVGMSSKKVWGIYDPLIEKFSNEFNILLFVSKKDLLEFTKDEFLTGLIIDNREGKIKVKPGYDGVYGEALIENRKRVINKNKEDKKVKKVKKEVLVKNDVTLDEIKKDLEKSSIEDKDEKKEINFEKQKTLF